jgi:hypothetical protein
MFLLDTNVVSELRRPDKANTKRRHLGRHGSSCEFFLSAISIVDIELGALQIARGDKAQGAVPRAWIDDQILPRFEGRILVPASNPPEAENLCGRRQWAIRNTTLKPILHGRRHNHKWLPRWQNSLTRPLQKSQERLLL